MLKELLRVCSSSVFYNHKVRYAIKRAGRIIHPMEWLRGLPLWGEIVWDRGGGITHNSRRYAVADERIYWLRKPAVWNETGLTSVWRVAALPQGVNHPCPFPLEIPKRCIRLATNPGDTVLDPYCGSGSTLLAALILGRRAIGIERVKKFCEVTAERMRQHARQETFAFSECPAPEVRA